ncbi:MAG: ABC transporter permease [Acidobacteria bacterium]|nr:ABC transporter permease [Acidobacteriota bacterium]
MNTFWQDVRYGWRTLLKTPGFTLIAIATLALGIGANTALFSVINAVLLRPLPYAQPERLVAVRSTDERGNSTSGFASTWPDFVDWRARQTTFEGLAAYSNRSFTLTGMGEAVRLNGVLITSNLLTLLRTAPQLGRQFTPEEEQPGAHSVILSHGLWQSRFNGDPQIAGRTLLLGGVNFTVVGVMPQGFRFPVTGETAELWISAGLEGEGRVPRFVQRGNHWIDVLGRLKPGVTLAQAQAEMSRIGEQLAKQYPDTNNSVGVITVPFMKFIVGDVSAALWTLFAAVGCVLLIACANVANLALARAATRQREIAVRAALGAQRSRVLRQLLTESMLLAIGGGLLGALLALWGTEALLKLVPPGLPRVAETTLDWSVLGFTLLVSLLTGVLFGLAPAWQMGQTIKTGLTTALKDGARGAGDSVSGSRLRNTLVVAQVALAFCLLLAAGLLLNSFWRLQQVKPGFDPHNLLSFRLRLPDARYKEPQQVSDFYAHLTERLKALPGVTQASASFTLPLSGNNADVGLAIEGEPSDPNRPFPYDTNLRIVQPGFFRTLGIELLQGRDFDARDKRGATDVVIVNETLARRNFPNQNPLGRRIQPSIGDDRGMPWREIIGVVRDVRHASLGEPSGAECYLAHTQIPQAGMSVALRTTNEPHALVAAVRNEVRALDAELPVFEIKTFEEYLSEAVAQPRFTTLLLSLFGVTALLLTAIGLYGVLAYSVTQRTREIGVRLALGAQPRAVVTLILKRGVTLTLLGIGLGAGASLLLTKLLKDFLFEVSATDPLTFAAIAVLLLSVALFACFIPARRATKVDPLVALRYE